MSGIRHRKSAQNGAHESDGHADGEEERKGGKKKAHKQPKVKWHCYDLLCWLIGNVTVLTLVGALAWRNILPSQHVMNVLHEHLVGAPPPDTPGMMLRKEGLRAKHPLVFVPGITTGGLELWEGRPCSHGLFRERMWGGSFGEKLLTRPQCWMDHMILDNETGLDPPGVRIRAVQGLVAADYFMPGYFVWAPIIENAAEIGYDTRNLFMVDYDWRLSFVNTEKRDASLSRIKYKIEMLVKVNGQKVVLVPHSMGSLYALHFLKWVEAPAPLGGGGGPNWVADHIHAFMNIGGPFLGVPKAVTGLISSEMKDVAEIRGLAPFIDAQPWGRDTFTNVLRITRTWDATMSMLPKGGEAVWGGLDWAPDEDFQCTDKAEGELTEGDRKEPKRVPKATFGRFLSFGREAAENSTGDVLKMQKEAAANRETPSSNETCVSDVWTEYQDIRKSELKEMAEQQVYTAGTALDLLRRLAPKMMKRADANWGYGIADDPSEDKYQKDPKYWCNPLETTLPKAPEMTVFCLNGVDIPTERAFVYKMNNITDRCSLPFQIDPSVDGKSQSCLENGVFVTDGDITVPVLSSGYVCAKLWKGKTKYNPHGSPVVTREYKHVAPKHILEGRGTQSGQHVDVMGNYQMIEDILKFAAGNTVEELGGDRFYSKIVEWSQRIKVDVKLSTWEKLGLA